MADASGNQGQVSRFEKFKNSNSMPGLLAVLLLLPYLNKPFHIDDPVFLAQGRHLTSAPADPLGFTLNWDGRPERADQFHTNPPLIGYYLAAGISLFGESELALHAMFLLFPFLAGLGMASLARRFNIDGGLAGTMLVAAPCFLVNATNLMTDVPVLSLMLLAIADYSKKGPATPWKAGVFAALAAMMKYSGFLVVPLFWIFELLNERKWKRAAAASALPVVGLFAWSVFSMLKYGVAHPLTTSAYLGIGGRYILTKALATFTFFGGACCFPLVFFMNLSGKRLLAACAGAVVSGTVLSFGILFSVGLHESYRPGEFILLILFSGIGCVFVFDFMRRAFASEDGLIRFLACWFALVFLFNLLMECMAAKFVLLLWPPAVLGLLLCEPDHRNWRKWALGASIPCTLVISLLLARADWLLAHWHREGGTTLASHLSRSKDIEEDFIDSKMIQKVKSISGIKQALSHAKFLGHWGFQYYMERAGAVAVDLASPASENRRPGFWLATEVASTAPIEQAELFDGAEPKIVSTPVQWGVRIMNGRTRAGFYCHSWGLLPWTLSSEPVETFYVWPPSARLRTNLKK